MVTTIIAISITTHAARSPITSSTGVPVGGLLVVVTGTVTVVTSDVLEGEGRER